MSVYTVRNNQGRVAKFNWLSDTEPTEDDIDEIFSGVIGKPTMSEPEPLSGFQKVRNVLEAPGKGVLNFIASSPQWIGGLIKEHGERAEETPDFWDWALTPQLAIGKAMKAFQAERTDTDEKIASFGDTMIKRNLQFIKDKPVLQPEEGKINEFMFSLGSGAGSLVGAIGLSLLTKSPHVAAMAFGAMAKGHTYQRAREAGKSERVAGRLSTAHGFGEAALESLGLRLIFGKYAGRLIPSMITEGIQEMSQEIWGNLVAKIGIDKAQKIMENVGMSGLIGFILGGGAGLVTGAVQNTESGQMLAESGADIGKVVTRMEETLLPQLQEIMESESGQLLISPEGEGVKGIPKELEPYQKDYKKTLSELEKWTEKLPEELKNKAILFGSIGDEKLYEKSYLARKTGKKATDIDIYVPDYDAFYDVETGIQEVDKEDVEFFGMDVIHQTDMDFYVRNDNYHLGSDQLLPTREFVAKVKETVGNKIVDLFVDIDGVLHQYHYDHDLKQPVFSPVGLFDKGKYDTKFAETLKATALKSGKPLKTFLKPTPPKAEVKPAVKVEVAQAINGEWMAKDPVTGDILGWYKTKQEALEHKIISSKGKIIKTKVGKVPLDVEGNELVGLKGEPIEINKDGTITLYHRTTPENAKRVYQTGVFITKENTNETFFSNKLHGQSESYGKGVVTIKVKPSDLRVDDAFPGGEISVAIKNNKLSKSVSFAPTVKPEAAEPKSLIGEKIESILASKPTQEIEPTKPPIKQSQAEIAKLGKKLEKPLAKAKVKPVIHEQAGMKKVDIPIAITEMGLLKAKLQAERRGAKAGERVGRVEARKKILKQLKSKKVEVAEIKDSIIGYAKENLTKVDRDRVTNIATRAKTTRAMARAMQMIDVMEERYQRHVAVDDIKKTVKGIDFKRLRPEYKGAIQKVTDSIDLVKRRGKTIDGLNSMLAYIERNPDHSIPDKQIQRLAILGRTKIENLTTEDINLINDSVKHLVKLNDLKGKIIIGRKIKDFEEVKSKSVENVNKKDPVDVDPREGIRVSKGKTFFTTEAVNAEHMCKQIDKQEHGEIKQVLFDGVDSGVSEILRIQHESNDYFKEKIGHIDVTKFSETFHPKRDWKKNVTYETFKLDSGKTIKLTPAERISLSLLELNTNSLRHILDGGIRLANNPDILYKLTAEDLSKIVSLNSAEADIANAIYHYFNVIQKDNLNKVSLRLNGWEVATEDDYFPIRVYGIDVRRPYLLREEALPSNMKAFTQSTLEGMGMLKERVASSTPLILEDTFATTYKSMKQASTYSGLAEPLRSAKALLLDPEFRTAINTRYGKHYWTALNNYVRDIEGEYQRTDNVDKMITDWINRLDIAILGLNPFVMLKQPISLMNAAVEMDSKYLLKALAAKPETTEMMGKHSPQLRDRFAGNVTRELGEVGQVGQVRKFWTGKGTLGQGLMAGIKNFDYQAIGRIWKAVEYETNALHPSLEGDAKMKHIAERTEEIVRLTQPTFHLKDRSSIGRSKNVWLRLMTKYTSQRNKNYMTILRSTQRYNASNKTSQDKAKLMKSIAIITLMNALMLYGVDELRNWLYKRKKPERRKRYVIFKGLEYMLGNVYLVGNAFRSLTSKIERGTYAGFDMSDILMSTGETGVNAIANTFRAIDQAVSQEKYKAGDRRGELKWKYSAQKGVDEALSFTLRLRGLPYDTVKKLLLMPFGKNEGIKAYKDERKDLIEKWKGKKKPVDYYSKLKAINRKIREEARKQRAKK